MLLGDSRLSCAPVTHVQHGNDDTKHVSGKHRLKGVPIEIVALRCVSLLLLASGPCTCSPGAQLCPS